MVSAAAETLQGAGWTGITTRSLDMIAERPSSFTRRRAIDHNHGVVWSHSGHIQVQRRLGHAIHGEDRVALASAGAGQGGAPVRSRRRGQAVGIRVSSRELTAQVVFPAPPFWLSTPIIICRLCGLRFVVFAMMRWSDDPI